MKEIVVHPHGGILHSQAKEETDTYVLSWGKISQ